MFRLVKKWALLPGNNSLLLIKVFCITGVVRVCIFILPFKWLARYLGNPGGKSPYDEDYLKVEASREIGRAIEVISRHTPWESKCLVQAITGKILLRGMGIANTLYLGVKKNHEDRLIAHAWLRVGQIIITGRWGIEGFKEVSCFADKINN